MNIKDLECLGSFGVYPYKRNIYSRSQGKYFVDDRQNQLWIGRFIDKIGSYETVGYLAKSHWNGPYERADEVVIGFNHLFVQGMEEI